MDVDDHLSVSIVIPVHDGGDALRVCLESVAACRPQPLEVVVVDDASGDDSARLAAAVGARCLHLSDRAGPAGARNRGAEIARGDIVFFVDADVALAADAVAEVLGAFRDEPHLAAVFGSYDDAPAAGNFLSQYKNLLHHYVHQSAREEASTFWAGCGAIRRSVFAAVGGFDESYRRPSIEDIELGGRLRRAGYRIRLRKSLQAKHLKRWTAGSLLRSDVCDRALPWTALLLRENGGLPDDLNLRWSSRISAAAAWALLAALAASCWWPGLWPAVAGMTALLLVLNAPLYLFLARRRGLGFALGSIVWHWLYYLYSTAAFVAGLGFFLAGARSRRRPNTL